MNKKTHLAFTIAITAILHTISAQTVIFDYDEAGNQIYRGLQQNKSNNTQKSDTQKSEFFKKIAMADNIGKSIKTVPVPVKTDLTVIWNADVKDCIIRIELLPYNSFKILSYLDLNKSSSLTSYVFPMTQYPYGVYYLKFYLNDGSIYTRTVTKN